MSPEHILDAAWAAEATAAASIAAGEAISHALAELDEEAERKRAVSPLLWPMDLKLHLLSFTSLRERLALRATCRTARALTALPEGWATLAAASWAAAQRADVCTMLTFTQIRI